MNFYLTSYNLTKNEAIEISESLILEGIYPSIYESGDSYIVTSHYFEWLKNLPLIKHFVPCCRMSYNQLMQAGKGGHGFLMSSNSGNSFGRRF